MNILSVQSQTVYGHVGNSAALPALQSLGAEVWAIPTALLSHHPGHGAPGGGIRPAAEIEALLAGLERQGCFAAIGGVLSGYLGTAANGAVLVDRLEEIRAASPSALYLCDPVMGDGGRLYVEPGLPDFFRARALPMADIVTPNRFELERLSGRSAASLAEALAAAEELRRLGPATIVCTGIELAGEGRMQIGTLGLDGAGAWLIVTPRLEKVPQGSGDLLAALLLGFGLAGGGFPAALARAVSATYAILSQSQGLPEMALIPHLGLIPAPPEIFSPVPL